MKRWLVTVALMLLAGSALAQVSVVPGGGGGGGGTPGGSNTQCQYNNAGAFGGITGCTTNGTAVTLVAPVLGTPASGTLTNATGLPEGGLTLSDVATNNSSTSNHGFLLKLNNSATQFMNGQGAWATPSGSGASSASIGNATAVNVAANSTSDQLLQALTLPAAFFNTLNQPFHIHESGILVTVNLTPTITFKVKVCSVSGCGSGSVVTIATGTSAAIVSAGNNQWTVNLDCTTAATGASGTLICHGNLAIDLTSGSVVAALASDSNTAVSSAIDLTAAQFIQFTAAFSAGSASNSITGQQGYAAPLATPTMANAALLTGNTAGTGTGTFNASGFLSGCTNVTSQATTGLVAETLASCTLPANTLTASGKTLRVKVVYTTAANANNGKILGFNIGATPCATSVTASQNGKAVIVICDITRTSAANAENLSGTIFGGNTASDNSISTFTAATEDLSTNLTLAARVTCSNTIGDCIFKQMTAEFMN